MNIGVYLTEKQIREVVRQELLEVLEIKQEDNLIAEANIGKFIGNGIGLAVFLAALQPTVVANAELPKMMQNAQEFGATYNELGFKNFESRTFNPYTGTSEEAEEIRERLKQVLTKTIPLQKRQEEVKNELTQLSQEYELNQTEEKYNQIIEKQKEKKQLEREISAELSNVKDLSDLIMQEGDLTSMIIKDTIEAGGDISSIDTQQIAREYLAKFAKGDQEAQTKIANLVFDDIKDDIQKIATSILAQDAKFKQDFIPTQGVGLEQSFEIAAGYANIKYAEQMPKNPTMIDVIYVLSNDKDLSLNLDTPKSYDNKGSIITQFNVMFRENDFTSLDSDELSKATEMVGDNYVIISSAEDASGLKENKVNKLRQRINELRGVYV